MCIRGSLLVIGTKLCFFFMFLLRSGSRSRAFPCSNRSELVIRTLRDTSLCKCACIIERKHIYYATMELPIAHGAAKLEKPWAVLLCS